MNIVENNQKYMKFGKNESLRTIMHQKLHNLFDYDWNYVKLEKSSREYRKSSEEQNTLKNNLKKPQTSLSNTTQVNKASHKH